ncbi:MAG: hypothetical protein AB7I79_18925 [Rhizobiaceae bacterium]|jgi:hypothetical protein
MDDDPLDRIPDHPVRAAAHVFRAIVALTLASRPLREWHASGCVVSRDGGWRHGRRKVFARDGPVNDGGLGVVRTWCRSIKMRLENSGNVGAGIGGVSRHENMDGHEPCGHGLGLLDGLMKLGAQIEVRTARFQASAPANRVLCRV